MKMEPTFNSRRIAVNGVTLNVIVEGKGPDVLLVHGFPDCHDVWRHQIPALVEAGYRVIAPDMRGCGLSDAPAATRDYKMSHLVSDLAAVLDALQIEKVRLVGHDHGALIGFQFCTTHPDRVDRFVAMSNGHPAAYARGPIEQKLKGWYVLFVQIRGLSDWVAACRRLVVLPNALRLSGRNAELDSAARAARPPGREAELLPREYRHDRAQALVEGVEGVGSRHGNLQRRRSLSRRSADDRHAGVRRRAVALRARRGCQPLAAAFRAGEGQRAAARLSALIVDGGA